MTASAWAFMLIIWGLIIGATVYCFWKLLSSQRRLDVDETDERLESRV
jgi:heme/copper-type cytochrome/quinol oxidase subunit 2